MLKSSQRNHVTICYSHVTRSTYSPFFFFNDTATTEIYTLSLHDALPISCDQALLVVGRRRRRTRFGGALGSTRSEEHTSELQSQSNLVCRLLLEKKKKKIGWQVCIYSITHVLRW